MASDNEPSCESDPNFAVICAFLEKFGLTCGLAEVDFMALQEMLEDTQEVSQVLVDMHLKLLRKTTKSVSADRWEKALIKFCHTFCAQDAWEIERFGYKKARLSTKIRALKELLEAQFDYNPKFKTEINKMTAQDLRSQPLGKDKSGYAYWFQSDNNCQIRVYKEDPDEETWILVARDKDGLINLINDLGDGDSKISSESTTNNEDSNSLAEKPIIDTGQAESNTPGSKKEPLELPQDEDARNGDFDDDDDIGEEEEADEEELDEEVEEEDDDDEVDDVEEEKDDDENDDNDGEKTTKKSRTPLKSIDKNGKKKRSRGSSDGEDKLSAKKKIKSAFEVGEAIEEPVMLIKGAGSGVDNEGIPIVDEAIEEPVMYFYGSGSGRDCDTGNDDKPSNDNESIGKKNSITDDVKNDGTTSSKEVPTTSLVKSPFKLGTIIDTKTDNKLCSTAKSPTKKSRWDVESNESEGIPDAADKEPEQPNAVVMPKFFFGPGCLAFKPKQPTPSFSLSNILESKTKGDIGYRIEKPENLIDQKTPEPAHCAASDNASKSDEPADVIVTGKKSEAEPKSGERDQNVGSANQKQTPPIRDSDCDAKTERDAKLSTAKNESTETKLTTDETISKVLHDKPREKVTGTKEQITIKVTPKEATVPPQEKVTSHSGELNLEKLPPSVASPVAQKIPDVPKSVPVEDKPAGSIVPLKCKLTATVESIEKVPTQVGSKEHLTEKVTSKETVTSVPGEVNVEKPSPSVTLPVALKKNDVPKPVTEQICVKKQAYTCGVKTESSDTKETPEVGPSTSKVTTPKTEGKTLAKHVPFPVETSETFREATEKPCIKKFAYVCGTDEENEGIAKKQTDPTSSLVKSKNQTTIPRIVLDAKASANVPEQPKSSEKAVAEYSREQPKDMVSANPSSQEVKHPILPETVTEKVTVKENHPKVTAENSKQVTLTAVGISDAKKNSNELPQESKIPDCKVVPEGSKSTSLTLKDKGLLLQKAEKPVPVVVAATECASAPSRKENVGNAAVKQPGDFKGPTKVQSTPEGLKRGLQKEDDIKTVCPVKDKDGSNEEIPRAKEETKVVGKKDEKQTVAVAHGHLVKDKADTSKVAPSKIDHSKDEPSKVEPLKLQPAKVEPSKVEQLKVAPIKVDLPKVNTPTDTPSNVAPVKVEPLIITTLKASSSKVESSKVVPVKNQLQNVEPPKLATLEVSPLKVGPSKVAPVKNEPSKIELSKVTTPQISHSKVAPAKNEPPKVEPPKGSTPDISPLKVAPSKVAPAKNEPSTIELSKVTTPQISHSKVESSKAAPAKNEPPKVEPPNVASVNVESPKVTTPKVSPLKVEPSKMAPAKNDPSKVEPSQVTAPKILHSEVEPPKGSTPEVSPLEVGPSKVAPAKNKPSKVEPPKVTTSQISHSKVAHAKNEPPKAESPNVAPVNIESLKVTTPKVSPLKVEPSKVAPAKNEPSKVEPSQVTAPKILHSKVEPPKCSTPEVSPLKVGPSKVAHVKNEPSKVEPPKVTTTQISHSKVEPPNIAPVHIEPPKVTTSKVSPFKVELSKVAPVKNEPLKVEPPQVTAPKITHSKVETSTVAPVKNDPPKIEPPNVAPVNMETPKATTPKVSPLKVGPSKVAPVKNEPLKVEPPQVTTQQILHSKVEASKVAPAKNESPKVEPPNVAPVNIGTPKVTTPKVSPLEVGRSKVAPVKSEPSKVEPPQVTTPKISHSNVAPVKNEPPKVEPSNVAHVNIGTPKATTSKVLPLEVGPSKVAPVKKEPSKVEPPQVTTPKISHSKVESSKVAPAKNEPPKVEPSTAAPVKAETPKVELVKIAPSKVPTSKVEPSKAEPTKVVPVKVGPLKVITSRVEESSKVATKPTRTSETVVQNLSHGPPKTPDDKSLGMETRIEEKETKIDSYAGVKPEKLSTQTAQKPVEEKQEEKKLLAEMINKKEISFTRIDASSRFSRTVQKPSTLEKNQPGPDKIVKQALLSARQITDREAILVKDGKETKMKDTKQMETPGVVHANVVSDEQKPVLKLPKTLAKREVSEAAVVSKGPEVCDSPRLLRGRKVVKEVVLLKTTEEKPDGVKVEEKPTVDEKGVAETAAPETATEPVQNNKKGRKSKVEVPPPRTTRRTRSTKNEPEVEAIQIDNILETSNHEESVSAKGRRGRPKSCGKVVLENQESKKMKMSETPEPTLLRTTRRTRNMPARDESLEAAECQQSSTEDQPKDEPKPTDEPNPKNELKVVLENRENKKMKMSVTPEPTSLRTTRRTRNMPARDESLEVQSSTEDQCKDEPESKDEPQPKDEPKPEDDPKPKDEPKPKKEPNLSKTVLENQGSKKMKMSETPEPTSLRTTRRTRNMPARDESLKVQSSTEDQAKNEPESKGGPKPIDLPKLKGEPKPKDVAKLKGDSKSKGKPEAKEGASKLMVLLKDKPSEAKAEAIYVESSDDDSCAIVEMGCDDPLAVSDEDGEDGSKQTKPVSLATFSMDFNDSPAPIGRRKRGRESSPIQSETTPSGKRIKMRGKRSVDTTLRKSVEEAKILELASSGDDQKDDEIVKSEAPKTEKKVKSPNKNKRILNNLGIDPDVIMTDAGMGVRQSRRIAQLKIREEADRLKLEEEITKASMLEFTKKKNKKDRDKDYKGEKKPKTESVIVLDEEEDDDDGDEEESSKKRKKKKHAWDPKKFNQFNAWRSSSGSSSENAEEEEEEVEESDDDRVPDIYLSDHEFSPESDLENDADYQPLKRARTVKKESDVEDEVDDCPCQKCKKSDHPEWILLCDKCDNGWHCSCLRPPLLVIPEGDWYCPRCQHANLLQSFQNKLTEHNKNLNKKSIADRRKERLAYVGITLNNVLPAKETEHTKKPKKSRSAQENSNEDGSSSEGERGSSESGSSESSDDEPIYQLRQRRQAHSYRFNDYDDLINSAIQDEMDAVKGAGNQGRGKDIATIVNAEKEEEKNKTEVGAEAATAVPTDQEHNLPEALPPVVPPRENEEQKYVYSDDDDVVKPPKKKTPGKKKHRKLNSLDISSGDDEDSDEDFKGTSSGSDEDFDDDLGSDESDSELDARRGRRGRNGPVRRSTRARVARYDADFIDDNNSDDSNEAPRRKKKRSIWDESEEESEESDRSWGRRKRKPASSSSRRRTSAPSTNSKKKKKKKRRDDDSDAEVYRKKKPKIKFGLDDDDDDGPVRRTRGKKITYVDALGSDSDDERPKRAPPRIESDEEEYIADEDEDEIDEDDKISEEEKGENDADSSEVAKKENKKQPDAPETGDAKEPDSIEQINKNLEDENEMEKMMEDEEYANKQLQLVALQLEKEKKRKAQEVSQAIKKPDVTPEPKKRGRKPKNQFQFPPHETADSLNEENDELSEPPGVSIPLFSELTGGNGDGVKKRGGRGKGKKSIEETVANLGTGGGLSSEPPPYQDSNIEIAAPPQPFSQSQPTPSVITRMLQNKPGQPGYPVGSIRPKQFASMPEDEASPGTPPLSHHAMGPQHGGPFPQGGMRPQMSSPYRQQQMNHYSRGTPPPHQLRMFHPHRPMDPSPSGGGAITMTEHSPGRVASPASGSPGGSNNGGPGKETPPPPYQRPPTMGRYPPMGGSPVPPGSRHVQHGISPHLSGGPPPPPRSNMPPYHTNVAPPGGYHYSSYQQPQQQQPPPPIAGGDESMAAAYQNAAPPYSPEQFPHEGPVEVNSRPYDEAEAGGGEFGGLVSYFSSQREDDLES